MGLDLEPVNSSMKLDLGNGVHCSLRDRAKSKGMSQLRASIIMKPNLEAIGFLVEESCAEISEHQIGSAES